MLGTAWTCPKCKRHIGSAPYSEFIFARHNNKRGPGGFRCPGSGTPVILTPYAKFH